MTSSIAVVHQTIGKVHCPMCTHTVDARLENHRHDSVVKPGQKCPRCTGSLDAAWMMRMPKAA